MRSRSFAAVRPHRRARAFTLGLAVVPVMLAGVALGAAGCKGCNDHALDVPATDAAVGSLTPEQAAKVLARIDDQVITLGDYTATLEHIDQFDRLRYQSPERRRELLDDMINVRLLAREAKAKGYDQDPTTQEAQRMILRNAMLQNANMSAVDPNDVPLADVQAYYQSHTDEFRDPERRRASVIVLKDEATAKAVLAQALAAKTAGQFGELVRTKSVDAAAKSAQVPTDLLGDVGMVSPPGDPRGENARISEPVRAALFKIQGGDGTVYPEVVPSGDTWTIVRLTGISVARSRSFAEAERAIRVRLAADQAKQKQEALLASLKSQFPVTIDEAALAQVRVDVDGGGMPSATFVGDGGTAAPATSSSAPGAVDAAP